MPADAENHRIETERLILRNFEFKDSSDCLSFLTDYETCMADGGYKPFSADSDDFKKLMRMFAEKKDRYMIELKGIHQVIGTVNFTKDESRAVNAYEIGYVVAPCYRRKGYAYEALCALITYFFENMNAEMLLASTYDFNEKSMALLEKLGFVKEGIVHRAFNHREHGIIDVHKFYLDK